MIISKQLRLALGFLLLVAVLLGGSSYFSQLKQSYITWKQIRFLDKEFHILKSKEEIIKLENLSHFTTLKPYLDRSIEQEYWSNTQDKNISKNYSFSRYETNITFDFYGENSVQGLSLKKALLKNLGPRDEDFDVFWDIQYKNKKFHVVFRPTDEEKWAGYVFWILITPK